MITVRGTGERLRATVVRDRISYVVGGKRLSDNEANPRHLVKVGRHWRWIEQCDDLGSMKRKDCGFERG
jgi:hypothetical protein